MITERNKLKMKKDETNSVEKVKKPRKHKKKWVKVAIPVAVVLVIVIAVAAKQGSANTGIPVYTEKVQTGNIVRELSTSGNITAENTKTFFSPAASKIAEVEVQKGDVVKKGDMLICFDEEAVAFAKKQNELDSAISSANYNANVQDNNEQNQKLAEAEAEIATYQATVDNYHQYINDLKNGISDETAKKKADLYDKIYNAQKSINTYDLAINTPNEDTDVNELMRKKTEKENELTKLQNQLSMISDYKTTQDWEDLLTKAEEELKDYEEKLQEAKSKKTTAEAGISNSGKITGYQLNKEKSQLTASDSDKKYDEALNGIVAEFDGVVTDLTAVEGASVTEGAQLAVLQSFDQICVEFNASKYDLETLEIGQDVTIEVSGRQYEGKVTKINHMAEVNSSGVPMVGARVHITNPDDNIYLGIEAKLKIKTATRENVLCVPVGAVNVDNEGSFCYVNNNGILERRNITTGISSEEYMEVLDGLKEGEEIVTSSYMGVDLEDGMAVTVMEGEEPATDQMEG